MVKPGYQLLDLSGTYVVQHDGQFYTNIPGIWDKVTSGKVLYAGGQIEVTAEGVREVADLGVTILPSVNGYLDVKFIFDITTGVSLHVNITDSDGVYLEAFGG